MPASPPRAEGPSGPAEVAGPDAAGTFSATAIGHHYSGVVVLRDIDFDMRPGDVHALLGENGSGKSTLIRILTGAMRPAAGELRLDGAEMSFGSVAQAHAAGIGVVYQDYNLFGDLSVAANVLGLASSAPRRRGLRTLDGAAVERRVGELLSELGIDIPPRTAVRRLGPAERKFVEIARAMVPRPRFLILDEPTASLEPTAAEAVLDLLRRLRARGVGLAFVSHRLDEVVAIADRITVLRDGRLVAARSAAGLDAGDLAELVVGGEVEATKPRPAPAHVDGPPAVSIRDVRLQPGRPCVSLDARRGEILGVTGLLGCGASDLVRLLGGVDARRANIEVSGRSVRIHDPRDAARAGIGFIPEDRKALGLVADMSVEMNIALASLSGATTAGVVRRHKLRALAERYRDELRIKAPSLDAPVSRLSGGNQQKVLLARWLASGVDIIAVEEPTHGVDVGAKAQVHALLRDFADAGGTVIVASTDVSEVLELCDRVAVMRHGAIVEVVTPGTLTQSDLRVMGARDQEDLLETLVESGPEQAEA